MSTTSPLTISRVETTTYEVKVRGQFRVVITMRVNQEDIAWTVDFHFEGRGRNRRGLQWAEQIANEVRKIYDPGKGYARTTVAGWVYSGVGWDERHRALIELAVSLAK